ncbi:family 16 glycoside hydrolase [Ulvibacterium marinum]|uniref:family 16 glycoside hydrolase n=1 Tax=Ulvibacterium marinum TaxID=2419782 RepID=UPI002495499B|nr:family 16 glycoside hydrolase [Ulvibacterium marinum]
MKSILCLIALVVAPLSNAKAQKIAAEPQKWEAHNCKVSYTGEEIHITNEGKGSALLWINNLNFKNGSVELDIKGKDERGNSFLGLAFHGKDNTDYEAVYFRPFNFKSEKKKGNSIQYINPPEYHWDNLRERFPGKYENKVSPVPDPNDWFHVKIEINYPNISVYVNDSTDPTLKVAQISKRKNGRLGLWVDSDEGRFKNIEINKDN